MKFIFKIIASISIIILSLSSISLADDHISKKEIIVILKQEITELGDKPKKRGFLQASKDYIVILKEQKKEIEKRIKIEAARKELVKE